MKAVILAGGRGTRLAEETSTRPKPMVEIGGKPILWHIMKQLSSHDIDEFIICVGHLGYVIKEWFANYTLHTSDVTFDMRTGETQIHASTTEPWRVTLIETGEATMTGGRLKRVLPYVADDEEFLFTYGDGVSNVDIGALVAFHREQGRKATVTAVQPTGRFGALGLDAGEALVRSFHEKPRGDGAWINGGYFVLHPSVGEYIAGDETVWENGPLERLARDGELAAYRHEGYWQAMDTLRDRLTLQALWDEGAPPWRTWA